MVWSIALSFVIAAFATLLYAFTYSKTMRRFDGKETIVPPSDCIWVFITYFILAFVLCKDYAVTYGW